MEGAQPLPRPLPPWGGGHPLPTPYLLSAFGLRRSTQPQGRLPKIRANLVLPPQMNHDRYAYANQPSTCGAMRAELRHN